jgi:hypothetical protein
MIRQMLRFIIILLFVSQATTGAPGCFAALASQPVAGTSVQANNDQSAGISNPDRPSIINCPAPKIENSSPKIHNGNNPQIKNESKKINNDEAEKIKNQDRNIINNEAPRIENQDRGIHNPEAGQIFNSDKFIFNRDSCINNMDNFHSDHLFWSLISVPLFFFFG